jgi:hypothetical protein
MPPMAISHMNNRHWQSKVIREGHDGTKIIAIPDDPNIAF